MKKSLLLDPTASAQIRSIFLYFRGLVARWIFDGCFLPSFVAINTSNIISMKLL